MGVDGAGSAGAPATRDAVVVYRGLLERYHRTLDLMSDRGLDDLDAKLVDAEAYARAVERWAGPGTVVDVGSGAGLPGVVVAAAAPRRPVLLAERRRRRATFLGMVAAGCGLTNVTVIAADVRAVRAEQLTQPLAAVTAQAVAGWPALYAMTRHLHADSLLLVGRRGQAWTAEVDTLSLAIEAKTTVVAAEPLGRGGTLVVLRVPGGRPCR